MNDWNDYREWHLLFDGICNCKGFYDNADLAGVLCAQMNRHRREDFEAAKSRLQGWRTGKRLPRRSNLLLMASILQIDENPDLRAHWIGLYEAAKDAGRSADTSRHDSQPAEAQPMEKRKGVPYGWIALSTIAVLGCYLAGMGAISNRQLAFASLPEIGYDAHVRMALTTSRLIHGEYDTCKGPPPSWDEIAGNVPLSTLGRFADGGLARKMVNDCGKEMIVRAVMFTAEFPGIEEIYVLDDYMKFEVFERAELGGK
jgi:hypothetical protein